MDVLVRCTSCVLAVVFSTNVARRCRLVHICSSLTLIAVILYNRSAGHFIDKKR
jgi:hypothetical protein